ncbi:MAG TPA: biotin/lipoyl-binding protein [Thermoanaerobaculia bacterium]
MKSITILTLALTLAACARHDAPTPTATAVELAPVREESRGSATRYSATVEPDAQVAVAFRVSGYVDAITVEEGDRVAKGTVLARIRTADYEQKLGQAAASQAEARAALAQAKSDLARRGVDARTSPTDQGITRGLRRPGPWAPDPIGWPSLRDTLFRDTRLCRGG